MEGDPTYMKCRWSNVIPLCQDSTGKGNYNEVENNNLWKGSLTLCGSSDDYRIKTFMI